MLLCLLVCMATYRSPAVALMPDLTPKPLRSRANAVINLMGAAGGIFYLIFSSILYSGARTQGLAHVDYRLLFAGVSGLMVLCVTILLLTVKERRLALEPEPEPASPEPSERQTLPRPVKKSLFFLLLSVALWYIAYNAVTTWFTTYAGNMWGMSLGQANQCLTVAMAGRHRPAICPPDFWPLKSAGKSPSWPGLRCWRPASWQASSAPGPFPVSIRACL